MDRLKILIALLLFKEPMAHDESMALWAYVIAGVLALLTIHYLNTAV